MEMVKTLQSMLLPAVVEEQLAKTLLEIAEGYVLNRRYPFGVPSGAEVEPCYQHIQLKLALEIYSKMGAEGQISHDENGIRRTFESGDVGKSLLKQIIPMCGSVRKNAMSE